MGPKAGQHLINPLHQTQVWNPEFSQEDINKENWLLLERMKEKMENIQQALKHAARPFLCIVQEIVPHFPFILILYYDKHSITHDSEQALGKICSAK